MAHRDAGRAQASGVKAPDDETGLVYYIGLSSYMTAE